MNPTWHEDTQVGLCPHIDDHWACLGCERIHCRYCDGIPGDETLCWGCLNAEDDAAVVA